MRTILSAAPRRAVLLLIVVAVLLLIVPGALAKIRTPGGGDVPFYARIEGGEAFHNDDWAAIVFYRPPECVPGDFDLLSFYDEGASACPPPTTDGFMIWAGEPGLSAPIQIKLRGLGAVPVWFVPWPALEAAMADDELTMTELVGLQPLVGSASFYSETLHPTGGAQVPMINYVAYGSLDDGGSFQLHATLAPETDMKVRIKFQ